MADRRRSARHFRELREGASVFLALAFLALPGFGAAQINTMPSTLRYGSGLLNIPVASVLPHLTFVGTYSGFGYEEWRSGGSFAVGFFDRVEVGATLQHDADLPRGDNITGAFGRLALLPRSVERFDLAVGARYVSSPSWSPYLVATAMLPGIETGPADYDVTLSLGWGGDLGLHRESDTRGLFLGSAIHLSLGAGRLLNLMAEFDGFAPNVGVQLDFGGIRVGAFSLGSQHEDEFSTDSRRFGVTGSVALCAGRGRLCRARPEPPADTVTLPAPPPDTVVIERVTEPLVPEGTPATLCLATGTDLEVLLTAAGDTLVGATMASIASLRPGMVFAGAYAEDHEWFRASEPVTIGGRRYDKVGGTSGLNCGDIVRIGSHEGVPLFADRAAAPPFVTIHVPARPGSWQQYRYDPGGSPGLHHELRGAASRPG